MKIGILTFSRTHNYGAILQCYALQRTLEKLNHHVGVIEYKQPYIEEKNRTFVLKFALRRIKHPILFYRYIRNIWGRYKSEKRFDKFKSNFLNCTTPCSEFNIPQDFDGYIIGSDQVWSTKCTNGIDKVFWGKFKRNSSSKLYTYAISTDTNSLEKIVDLEWPVILQRFVNLSFRENSVANFIMKKSTRDIKVSIDPTLLLDSLEWNEITNNKWEKRKYVLVYQVRMNNGSGQYLLDLSKNIADSNGWEVIILDFKYTPSDFVSLFKYAQYIVTSSFHGTVFSLIFNKPLSVVCLNDGHDDRYVDLMRSVNACEALVKTGDPFHMNLIDYQKINSKISELRRSSMSYLKAILS